MKPIEEIVVENQNLIYSVVNEFGNEINKEDLFQVGVMGMIKAYKNFDESLNIKFTTYAYTYILGEIKKYIREDRGFKVSRQTSSLGYKIEKARELLAQKYNRVPTYNEIAIYLEIPEYVIAEAINSKQEIKSIDSAVAIDSKELTLHETIPSKREDIDSLILLKEELLKLEDSEKELLHKRYFEDMTQTEVANAFGMTQVQVSRSEKKVLTKLKSRMM
ncbi:MAG: sigma-70 family RNA polymerase sigma factor [Bacilli bacterium]|nr:sigma-70 family RNA polymerase sigma factor [Bacilli bacterium]